jgi:hypothetical protein
MKRKTMTLDPQSLQEGTPFHLSKGEVAISSIRRNENHEIGPPKASQRFEVAISFIIRLFHPLGSPRE